MLERRVLFALIIPVAVFSLLLGAIPVNSAANGVGTVKVTKSIPAVSLDDRVSVVLTVENNGTVPLFDLQVYEYLNAKLLVQGSMAVRGPSGVSEVPLAPGGLASVAQVIVDAPPPNTLMPGQKLTLSYTQVAPRAGDFQIPTSLVWYSYKYAESTIRASVYSNGLMLHVPNEFEKDALQVYPYVLSATTFTSTITVLLWARRKLAKLKN